MEDAAANSNDNDSILFSFSCSSTTNWTIVGGSLLTSITFESSLSAAIDDDQNNSSPKSPLILYPPTPDPSPCEITITFPQKHELRQVYIRSTARLYEIYYACDLGSSNEYLCTVRCGIATRDEQVLHTPHFEEAQAVLAQEREGSQELDEKKTRSESSSSTNDDGWVEVKSSDTAQTQNDNSPTSYSTKPGGSTQDLYEATVEISDADPCISITLRLLSLQNKGCVIVDEIFVFGDPVEPDDSESRASRMENPVGSSFMAMFMPSLLQLSKARSADRGQDDHAFDNREKHKSQEIGSNGTDLINVASKIQQEENSGLTDKKKVKLQETVGAAAIPPRVDMPPQVSDTESKPNLSSSHIEKVLDHLVSRLSGIENLFLRFEERMLKPINSIEARLEHVEQQLEELNKKSQNSGMRCCTRISAPEFSCHELDDVFDNNENNIPELDERGCPFHIPPEVMADLENGNQPLASLSVAAPEFSSVDDEEENDSREVVTGSSKDSHKRGLSVDDALASALAGFLSSTSAERQKYTQALAIKAPDFSFEEDSSGKKASREVKDGIVTGPPIRFIATNEIECIKDSESSSSNAFCLESEVEVKSIDDHYSKNTREGVVDRCQHNEGGKDDAQDRGIYHAGTLTGQEFTRINSYHLAEDIGSVDVSNGVSNTYVLDECEDVSQFLENQTNDGSEEFTKINLYHIVEDTGSVDVSNGASNTSVLDECEAVNQFRENQTDDGSDNPQEGVVNSEFSAATEFREEESVSVIPQSVLEFPRISSIVDFEIPILDVKFVSQEISNTKSLLEALLADIPEMIDETPSTTENDDGSQIGEQGNLIPVDDWEATNPSNGNHFSVDVDYCSLGDMPLNVEDEILVDCYTNNNNNNNNNNAEHAASLI